MQRASLRSVLAFLCASTGIALLPGAVQAQATSTKITGQFAFNASAADYFRGNFTCTGAPTCTGTYSVQLKDEACSNAFNLSDGFIMMGIPTGASGPFSGSMTFKGLDFSDSFGPGNVCSIRPGTQRDITLPYAGTWNAAAGTATFNIISPDGPQVPGTYKADIVAPPVFNMVVRANIDPIQSTAVADIQFRTQDVGSNGSVYVFATAPAARVRGSSEPGVIKTGFAWLDPQKKAAGEKADSCVISQLNSSGQLVAVTLAQMQAFLSGTLSASGASVTIMNNTPTPNVAGATFYVGYGASSSAMINNGVFRNAVLVPGTDVCPMLPSLTALWWNPAESGWGLNLNHQGSTVFGTLFTYDAARAPSWFVMSGGVMQSDGVTYTGDLYRTTGPAFNANPFTPIGASNVTRVGSMSVAFNEANFGTLTYSVNGVSVTKSIQRQVYGTRAANCLPTTEARTASTNYQDLWWIPTESGWGLNVTHQDSTLFATLFTYDATGRDMWLVMSAGTRQSDGSYLGDLYRTAGPAFNTTPFTGVTVANVGTMRLRFNDGNTGTLTYTVSGVSVTKNIQRQVFSSPVSTCN